MFSDVLSSTRITPNMNVKISVLNIYKIVSNYILFTNKLIIGIRDE